MNITPFDPVAKALDFMVGLSYPRLNRALNGFQFIGVSLIRNTNDEHWRLLQSISNRFKLNLLCFQKLAVAFFRHIKKNHSMNGLQFQYIPLPSRATFLVPFCCFIKRALNML